MESTKNTKMDNYLIKDGLRDKKKTTNGKSKNGEKSVIKRKTNASCCQDENLENKNERETIAPKQRTRKNKKANAGIKEKETKKNEQAINKVDDEGPKKYPSENNSTDNKKNRINKLQNSPTTSPSKQLELKFSNLQVDDKTKEVFASKEIDLIEKPQIKNSKKSHEKTTLNCDILLLNTSPQTRYKKSNRLKSKSENEVKSHKVTEYFPVRRSERKCKVIDEKEIDLQIKILNKIEDGLEIKEFEDKGRGIVTTKEFRKGDFVVEYLGDLIDGPTAKQREIKYSKNKNIGCYMYYFRYKDTQYCVDATEESGKLGRLINHSRKGNLVSKIIEINCTPHIILFAKTDIPVGTEILYDYGDRNQESIKNHPWLVL